jgi:DNA-binding XRE family transcriptional regulator
MPVSLDEMMKGLSPQRRQKIKRETSRIIEEVRLSQLRKAQGLTQKALADRLKIAQATLSEIEGQEDSKLSTLTKVVEEMGGKLRILAEMPDGRMVPLTLAGKAKPLSLKRRARRTAKPARASRAA